MLASILLVYNLYLLYILYKTNSTHYAVRLTHDDARIRPARSQPCEDPRSEAQIPECCFFGHEQGTQDFRPTNAKSSIRNHKSKITHFHPARVQIVRPVHFVQNEFHSLRSTPDARRSTNTPCPPSSVFRLLNSDFSLLALLNQNFTP